jgi:hypothetical protein
VFAARYELNSYIVFRKRLVSRRLKHRKIVTKRKIKKVFLALILVIFFMYSFTSIIFRKINSVRTTKL